MRVAVVTLALLGVATARADDSGPGFSIGAQPVWFLLGGPSGGGTVGIDDRGAFAGGELSLVRLRGNRFAGLYADGAYDFAVDGATVTAGPELGLIRRGALPVALGVDGGVAVRFVEGGELGGAARLFFSVAGTLSIYGRYLHFGTGDGEQGIQLGLALKLPLIAPLGAGAP